MFFCSISWFLLSIFVEYFWVIFIMVYSCLFFFYSWILNYGVAGLIKGVYEDSLSVVPNTLTRITISSSWTVLQNMLCECRVMPTLDVLTNFSVSSSWEGITKSAGVVTVSPPLLWYDDVSTTVSAAQWCLTSFFLIQKNFLFFHFFIGNFQWSGSCKGSPSYALFLSWSSTN